MSLSKEQELKIILKEEAYKKILNNSYSNSTKLNQINYYFDTPSLILEEKGITLRIRNENNHWILCLKIKASNIDLKTYVSSVEYELEISRSDSNLCIGNPHLLYEFLPTEGKKHIKEINQELELLGSIKNTRYTVSLFEDINHKYELDHSIFPNGVEAFELEVEGIESEEDSKRVINNFKELNLEYAIHSKSKYKRFVEALNLKTKITID